MRDENIRTISDAKERIQESVNYYADRIAAFSKVRRVHKKDGGDFANIQRNFEGCRLYFEFNSFKAEVTAEKHYPNGGRGWETMTVYLDEARTPDEVEAKLALYLDNCKELKERNERGLAKIEEVLRRIDPLLDAIRAEVDAGKADGINYVIRHYVENNTRYMF